jgi:hypothetical protein
MESSPLTANVQLSLYPDSDRRYRLPGRGCRSLLYVFGEVQIGASAQSADGAEFTPDSRHDRVTLRFWTHEAAHIVHAGEHFDVWYGGVVGEGKVESVSWS